MGKRVLVSFTRLLAVAGVIYVATGFYSHRDDFLSLSWNLVSVFAFCAAVGYWILLFMIGASVWPVFLRTAGITISLGQAFSIAGKAQIGKYIPGNIFHFVSRVALASEAGISADITIASMGAETIVAVVTAGLMVVVGMITSGEDILRILPPFLVGIWSARTFVVIVVVATVALVISVNRTVRTWFMNRRHFFRFSAVMSAGLRYSFFFLTSGVVVNLLASAIFHVDSSYSWFDASWRFTSAWLVGFLVPGAPGGLGVREAVFLTLFGPGLGPGIAAGLAVTLRFITTISDVAVYGIALLVKRRFKG